MVVRTQRMSFVDSVPIAALHRHYARSGESTARAILTANVNLSTGGVVVHVLGKVVSINVARPKTFDYFGNTVTTGIYKRPIDGRVMVRRLNIDGDEQADTRVLRGSQVHGGELKAVYIYAADHYDHWRRELNRDLPHGQFGENLTVAGALEDVVRIGDTLRVGGALLAVTQPRMPCYKLDIKMEQPEFMKQFLASGRTGFYVRVLEEGEIGAGDEMSVIETDASRPTVLAVVRRESASG